jgi:hypothetical protein
VWQDALVAGIARLIDKYDIDGVYLDGTVAPWECSNRVHGCGYTRADKKVLSDKIKKKIEATGYLHPDDSVIPTLNIWEVRETMRRIYTVVKSRKPNGQVNVHNSLTMTIPTLSWATSSWDGESLGNRKGFILERLPLDAFRCEYMGRQWGIPAEFLNNLPGYTIEQAYAITLLHDVLQRGSPFEGMKWASRLWKLSDEFGRKEAEWLPYWRNSEYVTVSPEGAYVSLYRHPENGVLAVISNLSEEKETVKVQLNMERLDLDRNPNVAEVVLPAGEPLPIVEGKIRLILPSLSWKLIWVKP